MHARLCARVTLCTQIGPVCSPNSIDTFIFLVCGEGTHIDNWGSALYSAISTTFLAHPTEIPLKILEQNSSRLVTELYTNLLHIYLPF